MNPFSDCNSFMALDVHGLVGVDVVDGVDGVDAIDGV